MSTVPPPRLPSIAPGGPAQNHPVNGYKPQVIAIGASTGGPKALIELLPSLPANLPVPIVMVLHMPAGFTTQMATSLDSKCKISVLEATDKQPLLPGTAYLAPAGTQMKVAIAPTGSRVIRVTNDPPIHNCKPSVDYLFRSVALVYQERAIGVILTGMGSDGALGLKEMKGRGAATIAQEKKSCIVYGMPKEAVSLGAVDVISPLSRIHTELLKRVR